MAVGGNEVGMDAFGVGEHSGGEAPGVVGAQDARIGVREREVDQGLLAGGFGDLGGRALGPDGFADEPDRLVRVTVDQAEHARDDSARVGAQLGHVSELDVSRVAVEELVELFEVRGRDGDQRRTVVVTVLQEFGDAGAVRVPEI